MFVKDEKPQKSMEDNLVSPIDCLFYSQYQLPYKYLYILVLLPYFFSSINWAQWAALFEDGGFKICKAITKTYIENEIYDIIGGPNWGS